MTNTSEIKICQFCKHWNPYVTGELYGVRSFLDLPQEEQQRLNIVAKEQLDNYANSKHIVKSLNSMRPFEAKWLEWGECSLTELGKTAQESLALAIDGSDYMAILRCHGNFGCNQWKLYE